MTVASADLCPSAQAVSPNTALDAAAHLLAGAGLRPSSPKWASPFFHEAASTPSGVWGSFATSTPAALVAGAGSGR